MVCILPVLVSIALTKLLYIRLKLFTGGSMKIATFLDVMSCSLVNSYYSLRVFREHRKWWEIKDRNWGWASRPLFLSLSDSCPSLPVCRLAISKATLSHICVLMYHSLPCGLLFYYADGGSRFCWYVPDYMMPLKTINYTVAYS